MVDILCALKDEDGRVVLGEVLAAGFLLSVTELLMVLGVREFFLAYRRVVTHFSLLPSVPNSWISFWKVLFSSARVRDCESWMRLPEFFR